MWLIRLAMGRPVTILVLIVTIVLSAVLAARGMKVDIFPNLNLPVVYVVQPYGGMDPAQLEAFVVAHYENSLSLYLRRGPYRVQSNTKCRSSESCV